MWETLNLTMHADCSRNNKNQTPDTCHLPSMPTATPKDPPPAIYPTICSTLVLSWETSLFTQITKFYFSDALFDTLALQIIN